MGVSNENFGSATKIWGLNEILRVSNDKTGSPMKVWYSPNEMDVVAEYYP